MKNNPTLKAEAQEYANLIIEAQPKTEHDLIRECECLFDGFSISEKDGCANVYAEVHTDNILIGWTSFAVPSCTKFYVRNEDGKIINIEYFMRLNLLEHKTKMQQQDIEKFVSSSIMALEYFKNQPMLTEEQESILENLESALHSVNELPLTV